MTLLLGHVLRPHWGPAVPWARRTCSGSCQSISGLCAVHAPEASWGEESGGGGGHAEGWVEQLRVPGQGSREKGMWNFPEWGREVGGLVLERMAKRSGVRAGLVGAALQPPSTFLHGRIPNPEAGSDLPVGTRRGSLGPRQPPS